MLDRKLGAVLSKGFDDCTVSDSIFKLLKIFGDLTFRSLIALELSDKVEQGMVLIKYVETARLTQPSLCALPVRLWAQCDGLVTRCWPGRACGRVGRAAAAVVWALSVSRTSTAILSTLWKAVCTCVGMMNTVRMGDLQYRQVPCDTTRKM